MHNYIKFHVYDHIWSPKSNPVTICGLRMSPDEPKLINNYET